MENQSGNIPLEQIKNLSVAERILIVQDIWDSILISGEEIPITAEQKEELDVRLKRYANNSEKLKLWKEVRKKIQNNL